MDFKLLVTTFGAIFLAELGDKTNLATLTLAAGAHSKWAVFVGASLALVLTSALGVLLGGELTRFVSPLWLKRGAGLIFVLLGLFYLFGSEAGVEASAREGSGSGETQVEAGALAGEDFALNTPRGEAGADSAEAKSSRS